MSGRPLGEVHHCLADLVRRDLVRRAYVADEYRPGYALATRGLGAYVRRAGLVDLATTAPPPGPPLDG